MIPSGQLRLGNLVVLAHESNAPIVEIVELRDGFCSVHFIPKRDILSYAVPYEHLIPIELSENWLERLGFHNISKTEHVFRLDIGPDQYILIGKLAKNTTFSMFELWFLDNNGDDAMPYVLPDNNSVHSIQNLIFSLTGKELTIKEPINDNKETI